MERARSENEEQKKRQQGTHNQGNSARTSIFFKDYAVFINWSERDT